MANYDYSRPLVLPSGDTITQLSVAVSSYNSPRVNGKLRLRANPFTLSKTNANATNWNSDPKLFPWALPDAPGGLSHPYVLRAIEKGESDLRGRLARSIKNKEVGSLGVSIASAGQSISMLRTSGTSLVKVLGGVNSFYESIRGQRRLRRLRQLVDQGAVPTAGLVLEGFFGWFPLFEDFSNACKTLSNPWPKAWASVKVFGQCGEPFTKRVIPYYTTIGGWNATFRLTYATGVSVSNPNLWLGNKLGLINPFAVAWDLVPWSFAVNMISNMGQVMGSLSDFAGLSLTDSSYTKRLELKQHGLSLLTTPVRGKRSGAQLERSILLHTRILEAPVPNVTPYLRFPQWGVGTASIVGALLVQQTDRLTRTLQKGGL